MPTYEYHCRSCHESFTVREHISGHGERSVTCPHCKSQDVERVMKLQVDTLIPSSRLVPTCLNKGRPVVLEEPDSEVADSIFRFASRFIGAPSAEEGGELTPMPSVGKRRLFKR